MLANTSCEVISIKNVKASFVFNGARFCHGVVTTTGHCCDLKMYNQLDRVSHNVVLIQNLFCNNKISAYSIR